MVRRDPLRDVEPLVRRVYAYVAYRIGDGPEAEDVTGDVFERALRHRSSYDPRKGEPVAWLLGIARRCIADSLSTRRDESHELLDRADERDLAEESAVRSELREAVAALEPRDRELIALRYGADLTARQIGELLGERTNTVEVALHRALGRLRTHLDPREAEPRQSTAFEAGRAG